MKRWDGLEAVVEETWSLVFFGLSLDAIVIDFVVFFII